MSEKESLFPDAAEVVSAIGPEVQLMCAHGHKWASSPASTRCPVCGTTTFKTRAEWETEAEARFGRN